MQLGKKSVVMGTVEITNNKLLIFSHIIIYGNAATPTLAEMMRDEIQTMWNEPRGICRIDGEDYLVEFNISASHETGITDLDIYQNLDAKNNYFRIEEYAMGNISFVDGLGCNSGYFKLENLYKGSTTAAHEYGHTLGLDHPSDLDLRGKGVPGIMSPRGTLVDAIFQYNPSGRAGDSNNGGTMHPKYRKVLSPDIEKLKLNKLDFVSGSAVIGEFTSIWHPDHATMHLPGL